MCFGPECESHVDAPIARFNNQALTTKLFSYLIYELYYALVKCLKLCYIVKEPDCAIIHFLSTLTLLSLFFFDMLAFHVVTFVE